MAAKTWRIALGRFFRLRLSIIVLSAALFSILLAQIVLLVPSLYTHEKQLLSDLRTEVTRLVKVATLRDTLDDQSEKQIIEILEKLSFFSPIVGGQLYDMMGDRVGGFGSEASLSRNSIAADGVETLRSPDAKHYDIFVSQGSSGISYDLILRLDTAHIPEDVNAYMLRIAQSASIVSFITISGIMLILFFAVIRPIRRMRNAVMAAIDNPDMAEDQQLKYKRRDEIGEMGSAIDQLLMVVSIIYQDDLSSAHDAIKQSMSAIIQYNPEGTLISANPAALCFFCADNLEELTRRNQKFLVLPNRDKTERQTIISSIDSRLEDANGGSYIDNAIVYVNGLEVPVLIIARPVRKRNGQIQRYFANLVDISALHMEMDRLKTSKDRLVRENRQKSKRNEEIKKLLEACLILLDAANAPKTIEANRKPVMPDRTITSWYREAQTSGLTHTAQLAHGVLPVVMGNPGRQKALFRQALTLVYMRSKYATPQLTILTSPKPNGMSEFTISDTSKQAKLRLKPQVDREATDWKLCFAALAQIVTQEGGKLQGFADDRFENAVVFELISAPVDAQIDLQESNFAA